MARYLLVLLMLRLTHSTSSTVQTAHVEGKIAVILALPARHDVKSEMQKKEKGKWVQSNSSLGFLICILQLNTPDLRTWRRLHHCLKACPSFLFCTLFPSFPNSFSPSFPSSCCLCTEPQGSRGRCPGWPGPAHVNASAAASPITHRSCRAPAV